MLLSHIPGFNESYVPINHLPNFPKPLTELFDPNAMSLSYPDLLQRCEESYNNYVITADQAELVQKNTWLQAKSKVWFQQKSGRVTASRLKSVISTDVSQPSVSLIKSICYPDTHKFLSVACSYGCKHEDAARKEYTYEMKRKHAEFTITETGLVLDPLYPFLGATPDGLISCDCCGKGVLEIKCPYSCKQKDLVDAAEDSSFFLYQSEEGTIKLKENHQYYYQVQMQMKFCNVEYCDFVVWNKESWINERIYANGDFINDAIGKTVDFIKLGILPELVGRWYTKQSLHNDQSSAQPSSTQPSSIQPSSTQPSSTQPLSTKPLSTQPLSTQPSSSTQPLSTQPLSTQPSSTQPLSTQPLSTQPLSTQPSSTQPLSNQPSTIQPSFTQPQPSSTQPLFIQPASSQQPHAEQPLNVSDEQSSSIQDVTDGTAGDSWCYCRRGESIDHMIGCDNDACLIQWFHLSCLHLTVEQVPKGKWLCPECRHPKSKSKRRKYNP